MARQSANQLLGPLEARILGNLLLRSDRAWYRSELARALDVPASSLQRILARLAETGVLTTRQDGNRLYYQADATSPLYPSLRALIARTSGLAEVLRDALKDFEPLVDAAFVYGSIASGEAVSTSDVDLMIVGAVRRSQVAGRLHAASVTLGREINARFFTPTEFHEKLRTGDRFVRSVLERPKLFVLGSEDDLRGSPRSKTRRPRAD